MRGNLTNSQYLIWLGQRLDPDVPLYNMIQTFTFDGDVDPVAFARAFQAVVDGTDALRTTVIERDGAPHQVVAAELHHPLDVVDLSGDADPAASLAAWVEARRARAFDLAAQLFDTALLRLGPRQWVWYLNLHHLITDGWSFLVIYRRQAEMYAAALAAASAGDTAPQPNAAWPQFAAYAEHERAARDDARHAQTLAAWAERAARTAEPLEFFGRSNTTRAARTERVACPLGPERSAQLRDIARQPGFRALSLDLALYNLFAALTAAFLHRIAQRDFFYVGVPFHSRPSPAFKDTAGVFIEICPLALEVKPDDTFATLHKRTSAELLGAMRIAHAGVSSAAGNRAYEVLLNLVNVAFPDFCGMRPRVDWVHSGYGDRNHALRVQITDFEGSGDFNLLFDFKADLFTPEQRAWTIRHFLRVVDAFIADPQSAVSAVDLQTAAEREAHVIEYNDTSAPYPDAETVITLFRQQREQAPDAVAVQCGGQALSYRELDARSDALAHRLVELGAGDERPVVIRMPHGIEVVLAILAVLKAGSAYAPIDPAYPPERLAALLEQIARETPDVRPIVITTPALAADAPGDAQVVVITDQAAPIEPSAPIDRSRPDGLAYVIFTSGSTGTPKGVMIEHRSLVNYAWWARGQYSPGERLTWPLFTSLSFDLTVTSIFVPLISGGRIVAYPDDPAKRGANILKVVEDDQCDIVKLTPSHMALLRGMDLRASRIRKFIVGGEDFKTELALAITRAFDPALANHDRLAIYNEYGPTEATVGCMIHRFDPERDSKPSVPIGAPAANAQIFVLDRHGMPVPTGVVGEMFIGGGGLARGYFGRPELTAERFSEAQDWRSADGRLRLYRTGDLARWLPDGQLEFLGRADHQVKVGGARIELGEVEAHALSHPGVRECAVVLAEPSGGATWVAPERHCTRCGLASNYPGVSYDDAGVCNFCRAYESYKDAAQAYFRPSAELDALVAGMRAAGRGSHDCIVLFSGGKDSTYMLCRLAAMDLKILAFTLDNGYISEQAKGNIRRVVATLGVDHVFASTPAMNEIFADSLRRYANVCNGCFKTIYTLAVKEARERNIGHIVTGLSRGQFFETRLSADVFLAPGFDPNAIDQAVIEARKAYHRRDDAVSRSLDVDVFRDDAVFEDVQFIDFYRYCDVGLDELYAFLGERVPWIRPSDTGRSTNCLINDVGIYIHKKQRGFHNYALPYSWDVRLGHKTRQAALEELDDEIDEAQVERILGEIGYDEPSTAGAAQLAAYYVGDAEPAALRAHLAARLPDYMLPAHLVRLDAMPLTPNGKVDRAALPDPHEHRPELASAYASPRTATEALLAELWAAALRLDHVGVNDNFFELGGDSIISLQIVAKANQAGLRLAPSQLFQHQTVAELAAAVHSTATPSAEHGPATGPAPLTPIQHWFFKHAGADPHHWNQTMSLQATTPLDRALFERALDAVVAHHDALRARFWRDGADWRQEIMPSGPAPVVRALSLEGLSPEARHAAEVAAIRDVESSLDLERGVLCGALLIEPDDGQPQRVIVTIHHLVVDGVSWLPILHDLQAAYGALERGVAPAFPPKTASFRRWAEAVQAYAGDPARPALVWPSAASLAPLPADAPDAVGDLVRDTDTVTATIDAALTTTVVRQLPRRLEATIDDVLLAALGEALAAWTGQTAHAIAVEGHGRHALFPEIDTARTVGWFTAVYPVEVVADAEGDVVRSARRIAAAVRGMPHRGADYGVARYLAPRSDAPAPEPQVLLNYLGQAEALISDASRFTLAPGLSLARSPEQPRPYPIELNAYVAAGALRLEWSYNARRHRAETIEALSERFIAALHKLAAHVDDARAGAPSTADFPEADLSQSELDAILAEFSE